MNRYTLISAKQPLIVGLSVFIPIGLICLGIAARTGSNVPNAPSYSVVIMTTFSCGILMSLLLLLQYCRLRLTQIVAATDTISMTIGNAIKWSIQIADIESVTICRKEIKTSLWSEAIKLELISGKRITIPTKSILYGEMPDLELLIEYLRALGVRTYT